MRYALKFGYHGKSFSGYARQPKLRTIEGDIIKALKKTKIILNEREANFQTASRTDKGVSALGNVIAFNTEFKGDEILGALNAYLKEIWFYGIAEVESSFNPRHAIQRWYRYYLIDDGMELISLKNISKIFQGTYDFSNFARLEEGNDPVKSIDSIEISKKKEFIILDFKAQSFLWHMVRRVVQSMMNVVMDKHTLDDIKYALEGNKKVDFGISPPEPLILMDVKYDFEFKVDRINLRNLEMTLKKGLHTLRTQEMIYDHMLGILEE